ncbi:Acyl-coenzyme A thioesterase 13-like Protein [Tribolium castaneum]|uniref:Acyl-coenzyme A thioesterase 13-like Protein n=2 Tax=Tribolium castaneum TaxID=7070 RepID=D6X3Y1_TRICA|nr:PREDICTED: acyl-coenzyme A thioesterase 13 [Tribolium castaneum]EEZ97354.1 Acyl-coenzyme A thioesterase 13-like Protein [Tribolium castaneum]|eukprot:XP_968652.1 PREDICTED: acyl-coenzyme A thioesterase 13 [Tribolium castaneum]
MARIEECKQIFHKFSREGNSYDRNLEKAELVSVTDGKCSVEVKLEDQHTNQFGWMHGAFAATLVDCCTSLALFTKHTGFIASVDIHMNYLKGARKGDEIVVDCNVVKMGLTLAFIEATIKNKANGHVLVKATHTLYLSQ